ncbi:MAG: hypothetical protein C0513_06590 [Isosphaera sp.]|nr:hypothetical protein [Isosphaera sp.]
MPAAPRPRSAALHASPALSPARLLRRARHALVTPRWLGLPVPQFRKYPPALALRDIAIHHDALPPTQRDTILALGRAHWPAALRLCLGDPDPAVRKAAVARAQADPAAAPDILPAALCDADPAVALDAEHALERLVTAALLQPTAPPPPPPAPPTALDGAAALDEASVAAVSQSLAAAVDLADRHRRPGVLMLAARWAAAVPRPSRAPAPAWLSLPDHPAQILLRSLVRRADAPAVRAAAWAWLAHAPLARACVERLCAPLASDTPSDLLARAHLALSPARQAHLRAHAPKDHASPPSPARALLPHGASAAALPVTARLGLCRLLERWPAPRHAREEALARLLTDSAPSVRHAALRVADALDMPLLADLCFDTHPRVAASAAAALRVRHCRACAHPAAAAAPSTPTLPAGLARSPHPAVRALAGLPSLLPFLPLPAPTSPRVPTRPGPARAPLAGHQRAARHAPAADRPALVLTCDDHHDLARVLAARQRPLSTSDTLALCALVRAAASDPLHPTPRAAAAAAITLARASPPLRHPAHDDLRRALDAALDAPDPRLRSSALDAAVLRARRSPALAAPDLLPALVRSTADPAHRVRGSASRGLLLALAEPKLHALAAGQSHSSPATPYPAPADAPRPALNAAHAPAGDPAHACADAPTSARHSAPPSTPPSALLAAARKALTALLRDDDPAPRLAGLWAAHRVAGVACRLPEVPDLIRAIALRPASDHEALRATIAADRFAWELRADWSARAMA